MSECIEWQGAKWPNGYGYSRFKMMGVQYSFLVHRFVYEQAMGPIPEGLVVMHICDNRACFNLEHLRLGTQGDNIRDCAAKGRTVYWNRNKTVCKNEHEFTEENTYLPPGGNRRQCRKCKMERKRVARNAQRVS